MKNRLKGRERAGKGQHTRSEEVNGGGFRLIRGGKVKVRGEQVRGKLRWKAG